MKLKYLAALLLGMLVGVVAGVVTQQYLIPTTGVIATAQLSITWTNGTEVTAINWGATENGTVATSPPINITNTGNIPVTLQLNTIDPSTSIISLSLTWNYTGTPLQPGGWQIVELYQNVAATGPYSYTTVITATQT